MTRIRTSALLFTFAVAAIGLSGCAASMIVDYTAEQVTIASGETLTVDFGTINSSVGDGWVIVTEPDPAVLGSGEAESQYLGDEGSTGGENSFSYRFPTTGAGTTVIEFEYQFRGAVPEDPDDQETAKIEVTVK